MSYLITSSEYVEIDGVPFHTPAWTCENLWELWGSGDTRGEPTIIPGASGALPNPITVTATRRELIINIVGFVDWLGAPYDNVREGLLTNVRHLKENVVEQDSTTKPLILHLPDGNTDEGDVQILHFTLTPMGPAAAVAQLGLLIPAGDLTYTINS